MANMSYCRFHNTASDLADCAAALDETDRDGDEAEPLSRDEAQALKRLVGLCRQIVEWADSNDPPLTGVGGRANW